MGNYRTNNILYTLNFRRYLVNHHHMVAQKILMWKGDDL